MVKRCLSGFGKSANSFIALGTKVP